MKLMGRGDKLFRAATLAAVLLPLGVFVWLFGNVLVDGAGRLDWGFLTSFPSRKAEIAGVLPALAGTFWLSILTVLIAVPVGILAAIWLEEYGGDGRFARVVEVNINNLAGVPSILYGLLGLMVFVRVLGFERSLIAGACTLSLLILPIVIMAGREALRAVPQQLREASYGLGATQWQTTRRVVLPMAMPGMLTGAILAISRAVGETAPLIVVGALTYITFLPDGLKSPFSALPIQIFNWVSRPQEAFAINAAAGIIVLMSLMMLINLSAVVLRARLEQRYR